MKVTIIASRTDSPYNKELLYNINLYSDNDEKLTAIQKNKDQIRNSINEKKLILFLEKIIHKVKYKLISRVTKKIIKILNQKYLKEYVIKTDLCDTDIINLHYIDPFKVRLTKMIMNKNPKVKIIASLWGSDFLRADSKKLEISKYVYDKSEIITFNNEDVSEKFNKYFNYKYKDKIKIVRFGLNSLDLIDNYKKSLTKDLIKSEYDYSEKYIICVGTNSKKEQQHFKIIDELIKLTDKILNNILFIFPLTYGDAENAEKITKRLSDTNLKHIVLNSWIEDDDLAKLRLISDILIQLQTTDQFSGAMQEALYAENCVITGSWLPYDFLKNKGLYLSEIFQFDELSNTILELLKTDNSSKLKKNAELIWELGSWESNKIKWINLYKSI